MFLDDFRRHGIAITTAETLITRTLCNDLDAEVARVMSNQWAALQAKMESRDRRDAKRFLRQWLGRYPLYEPISVWGQIARALEPTATAYLGSQAILRFYNLWEITPTNEPPSRSQVWHTDHEDTKIAKAFLYLSDVPLEAGPLVYATGTHAYGRYAGQRAQTFCEVDSGWIRSTDEQMAAIVPENEWTMATGPKGTLVFADTAGYHKGGYATGQSRLVATWEWTTSEAKTGSHFHVMGPQP